MVPSFKDYQPMVNIINVGVGALKGEDYHTLGISDSGYNLP